MSGGGPAPIMDALAQAPEIEEILMAVGMHCIHCIAASGETLEEACYVHGIDPDDLIAYINEYFDAQKLSSEGEDPAQGEVVAQAAPQEA